MMNTCCGCAGACATPLGSKFDATKVATAGMATRPVIIPRRHCEAFMTFTLIDMASVTAANGSRLDRSRVELIVATHTRCNCDLPLCPTPASGYARCEKTQEDPCHASPS